MRAAPATREHAAAAAPPCAERAHVSLVFEAWRCCWRWPRSQAGPSSARAPVPARLPLCSGYQQLLPVGGFDPAYFEGATAILAEVGFTQSCLQALQLLLLRGLG